VIKYIYENFNFFTFQKLFSKCKKLAHELDESFNENESIAKCEDVIKILA
jgi:hypothetical protein